jgi:DNA primase
LPAGSGPLQSIHLNYLTRRGFANPDQLAKQWGLRGTGPIGEYKFRIIAPIDYNGRMVSYQGRDVTGKSPLRYKACPKEKELMNHKHTLYGMDKATQESVIVVEGIVDVWKLGPGAVATYGTQFTWQQVTLLARRWKRRYIAFDADAQGQAMKLANTLSTLSGEVHLVQWPARWKDPGDTPEIKAIEVKNRLIFKRE